MKSKSFAAACIAALGLLAHTHASSVTGFGDITKWIGNGANQAGFVVDFNDGTTNQSYVWGYRWDGTRTGEDMFRAVGAADPNLSVNAPGTGSGFYVDSITYDDGNILHTSDNGANGGAGNEWWTYYTADGTASVPGSWTESASGAGDRMLANNSWDGWSATVDNAWPGSQPGSPLNAVPEPSSILLLLAGLGLVSWVRKACTSKA